MLIDRLGEVVAAAGLRGIEVVVCIHGVQRRAQRCHAGAGNGANGQTGVGIGVVGADNCLIGIAQHIFTLRQHILDGSIDVQAGIELTAQAVIDHRRDSAALRRAVGLLFDQRRHDDHIVETQLCGSCFVFREAVLHHIFPQLLIEGAEICLHLLRDLVVKVPQEFGKDIFRVVIHIELIGVRIEIALQTAMITIRQIFQEPVVKFIIGSCFLQAGCVTDLLFLQHQENILQLIAFRYGDRFGGTVFAGLHHAINQCAIVIDRVQLIGAGVDLFRRVGDHAVEVEEPLILNQALFLQHGSDIGNRRIFLHRHCDNGFLRRQGADFVGAFPCEYSQQNRGCQHQADI